MVRGGLMLIVAVDFPGPIQLFMRLSMTRRLVALLALAPLPLAAQGFGTGVAMAGENLFVGRPALVPGFPMPSSGPGGVHVFHRGASGWAEAAAFAPSEGVASDAFGSAISADGIRVLVGAPGASAAYVYEWRQNTWHEVTRLTAPTAQDGDEFGASVLLQGDWALVGAPGRDGSGGGADWR